MLVVTGGANSTISSQAESITVSTTAVGLTAPATANSAVIQVQDQDIRWWSDASTPTATAGFHNGDGDWIFLNSRAEVVGFSAIREDGTDAVIAVQYG